MEKREPNSIEQEERNPWSSGFYETGSTTPPKDWNGAVSLCLIVAILAVSISSAVNLLRLPLLFSQTMVTEPGGRITFSTTPASFENFRLEGQGEMDPAAVVIGEEEEQIDVAGLGLRGYPVPEMYRYLYQMPEGLYLTEVDASSDAAKQGLQPGDVLISINGVAVTGEEALEKVLSDCDEGDTLTARVYCGSGTEDLVLTVGPEE